MYSIYNLLNRLIRYMVLLLIYFGTFSTWYVLNSIQNIKALSLIFQALPDDWKEAFVSPLIFKKGERSKPANYRLVSLSLTCICCKLIEHIITSSVMSHFEHHNILTDAQHGFRKQRSCESQLS